MSRVSSNEKKYQAIIEFAPDVIYTVSSDGKITSLNSAFEDITGWDRKKWIGKNFSELIHKNDLPKALLNFRKTLNGETRNYYRIRILSKNGEYIIGEFKSTPERVNKKVVGVIGIGRDVTEEQKRNDDLERRKNDFISIASHELKTPVTSIKGFMHLLKKEHIPYKESRSALYIDRIEKQLDKLNFLINDLIDVSRIEAGKLTYRPEKFVMSDIVKDVVNDLNVVSGEKIIHLKNGVHKKVFADRDRIGQVLINLISNAIKYSPKKNRVDVFLEDKQKNILVGVRDYGIGIEKDELENIFDRFYRVQDIHDKTFPGLGVGLNISREIIQRHKGKIWVESRKGRGSTFYFSLPIITGV